VGAGSGIWRARLTCWAERVYACDIDNVAVESRRRETSASFRRFGGCGGLGLADVVVANISPEVIISTRAGPAARAARVGVLLATGFERSDIDAVKAAFPPPRELRTKKRLGAAGD